ncbi:MAG: IS4 family transposase, partial [Actinobacteria bacterium]|nr:IS4 family transposase [Actinomycetota bacterium]
FRWRGRRLLAVDGARRFCRRSDELLRLGRPTGAHYPQFHVTTLFDVQAKVPLDAVLGPFGCDERVQLSRVLDRTRPGDVLVLDRGYPSFDVFVMLIQSRLDFVARLPVSRTSAKAIRDFVASGAREAKVVLAPTSTSVLKGTDSISLRAVRVARRDGPPWILLTTLDADEFPAHAVEAAYTLRWEIEEFYKLLVADYFDAAMFHATWLGGVEQEVYAQLLFVVITRHLMAVVARDASVPYSEISQARTSST